MNETDFLWTALIADENKVATKVCDMKTLCCANIKT